MKPKDIFTKPYFLPVLLMILVVAVMTGFSEGMEEREIIFPEITALATGMILLPRRPWKVSGARMILFISLCAVCGTGIVRFIHLPLLAQMMIAYLIGQIILSCSGTTMAPMISAIALPVLLQSGALIYPISAVLLTALIVAVRKGMEQAGLREPEPFEPVPGMDRAAWGKTAARELLVLILGFCCISGGWRFCIAPPLLVAFQEFTNPASPARKKPVKAVALIFVCAAIGSYVRLFLAVGYRTGLHLPLTLCAVIATAAIILTFFCFGMALPPAGALGILPMLVLPDVLPLFPLQILTGAAVLMLFACLFFRERKPTA